MFRAIQSTGGVSSEVRQGEKAAEAEEEAFLEAADQTAGAAAEEEENKIKNLI